MSFLQTLNLDTLVLMIASVAFAIVLLILHLDATSKFDVASVMTNAGGTFSLMKFGQLTSLLTSTWVIIYQTRSSVLTEAIFSLYIITWAGSNALSKYLDSRKSKE